MSPAQFSGDGYVSLPLPFPPQTPDWTIMGWFNWQGGVGPLIADENDPWKWGWVFDHNGSIGWRLARTDRITPIQTSVLQDAPVFLVVAKAGTRATL